MIDIDFQDPIAPDIQVKIRFRFRAHTIVLKPEEAESLARRLHRHARIAKQREKAARCKNL
jgi:hypothetical protein